MKYKKYTKEFKEKVVKEYLNGTRHNEVLNKYEINKSQLRHWKRQWEEFKGFPDGRGKGSTGRPKKRMIKRDGISDEEYIKKLEMEVDILKYMANLKNKKQK